MQSASLEDHFKGALFYYVGNITFDIFEISTKFHIKICVEATFVIYAKRTYRVLNA